MTKNEIPGYVTSSLPLLACGWMCRPPTPSPDPHHMFDRGRRPYQLEPHRVDGPGPHRPPPAWSGEEGRSVIARPLPAPTALADLAQRKRRGWNNGGVAGHTCSRTAHPQTAGTQTHNLTDTQTCAIQTDRPKDRLFTSLFNCIQVCVVITVCRFWNSSGLRVGIYFLRVATEALAGIPPRCSHTSATSDSIYKSLPLPPLHNDHPTTEHGRGTQTQTTMEKVPVAEPGNRGASGDDPHNCL